MRIREWFGRVSEGITVYVIGAFVLWIGSFLLRYTPFMSKRFYVPMWVLVSLVVTLVALVLLLLGQRRRANKAIQAATAAAVVETPLSERPQRLVSVQPILKLEGFDLNWEVTQEILPFKESGEIPGWPKLDAIIKGPFCPACGRVVQGPNESRGYSSPIHYVETPCGTCTRKIKDAYRRNPTHEMKGEVFREAQRLIRQRGGSL